MNTKAETAGLKQLASMADEMERAVRRSAQEIWFAVLYFVIWSVLCLWVFAGVLAPLGAFFARGAP
jgi:hypothetical protein